MVHAKMSDIWNLAADIQSSWNFACNLMLADTMFGESFKALGDFYAEVDVLCQNF